MTDSERIDELTRRVAELSAKVDLLVRHNVPKVRCDDDGSRNPYWLPRRDGATFWDRVKLIPLEPPVAELRTSTTMVWSEMPEAHP